MSTTNPAASPLRVAVASFIGTAFVRRAGMRAERDGNELTVSCPPD
jgi:hypothetical protein